MSQVELAEWGNLESHVRRFAADGVKVVISDLNEEKGQAIAQDIGGYAFFIKHGVFRTKQHMFHPNSQIVV